MVDAAGLAAMLAAPPTVAWCTSGCTAETVCGQHRAQYPQGPPPCRGRCGIPLDPVLWQQGIHLSCTEPAPIPTTLFTPAEQPVTPPAVEASPPVMFAAPAGTGRAHPLKGELIDVIRWAGANAPRSRQRAIGPSELGVECMRRLAYRFAGAEPVNTTADPWFSILGTGAHDWLTVAVVDHNAKALGRVRWLPEQRVTATHGGFAVSGSCDLYDHDRAAVIDWKIVGKTSLTKYTDHGPSQQYRTQVHTYGLGHEQAGRPVREVVLAFLPRNGYLTDAHVWAEPYDRQVAVDALARAATVQQLAAVLPPALIPAVPDAAACCWCPFYRPGGPADTSGCPGPQDPGATERR